MSGGIVCPLPFSSAGGLGSPPISFKHLTSVAEAVDIATTKVAVAVRDGDFIANFDILHSNHFHLVNTFGIKSGIGIAIMIDTPNRTEQDGRILLVAGNDNAKVAMRQVQIGALFDGKRYSRAGQVFDSVSAFDALAGGHGSLVSDDGVAIGAGDFPRAVGRVHGNVLAEMAEKILLLVLGAQAIFVSFQGWKSQQSLFSGRWIFAHNELVEQNLPDFVEPDTPHRHVPCAILPYCGLAAYLEHVSRLIVS